MKILYLNPIGRIGGAERVLLELIAGIRRNHPEFDLEILACEDGPLLDEARARGAAGSVLELPGVVSSWGESTTGQGRGRIGTTLRMARAAPGLVSYVWALRAALAERSPDVVHSNGLKTHVLGRAATSGYIPIVWHLHDFLGGRAIAPRLLRCVLDGRTHGIAISEAVSDDARRALPRLATTVIRNGVDLATFHPEGLEVADLDHLAGLTPAPAGTVRIGLVATYARWKGHDVYIEAASRVLAATTEATRSSAPIRFFIIGGPIYRTGSQFDRGELEQMADRLGIADQIGFVEHRSAIVPVYRALDVVVHASVRPEPFGMTIAEAMACGRPVVVSLAGGVGELVTPDRDALTVPPGDPGRLAEAIGRLARDPRLRGSLGEAARVSAVQRFDHGRLADRVVALYRSLRSGDPVSGAATHAPTGRTPAG